MYLLFWGENITKVPGYFNVVNWVDMCQKMKKSLVQLAFNPFFDRFWVLTVLPLNLETKNNLLFNFSINSYRYVHAMIKSFLCYEHMKKYKKRLKFFK